jgi:hypothetical protein
MYGASNDWFFSTPAGGVALFDDAGAPRTDDVTADISIRDAGTELDEEPGVGPNNGGPEGPPDTDTSVRIVAESDYAVPASQHVTVTISPALAF